MSECPKCTAAENAGELYQQGKYREALRDIDNSLTSYADLFYQRGLINYDLGQFSQALNDFNQALKFETKEEYLYHYARTFFKVGNFERAIQYLSLAISGKSENSYYYFLRGKALLNQKHYQRAFSDFKQASGLEPQAAIYYYYLGLSCFLNHDYSEAIQYFNQAINLDPQDATSLYQRGLTYLREGNRSQALQDFQASLMIRNDPDVQESYRLLIKKRRE